MLHLTVKQQLKNQNQPTEQKKNRLQVHAGTTERPRNICSREQDKLIITGLINVSLSNIIQDIFYQRQKEHNKPNN